MEKGCQQKFPSSKLQDYVTNMTHVGSNSDFVDSTWYPIDAHVHCSRFSDQHRAFIAAITASEIGVELLELKSMLWKRMVLGLLDISSEKESTRLQMGFYLEISFRWNT